MSGWILAIDCTQRETLLVLACARGARDHERISERRFLSAGSDGHERFYDHLRALEREAGIGAADLAAVAVAVGPGGFTGLRVSISFAKAVSFARGIPALAVPSAALFAHSARDAGERGPFLVALAAKGATVHATVISAEALDGDGACAGSLLEGEALLGAAEAVATAGGVVLADEHLDAGVRAELVRRGVRILPHEASAAAFADRAFGALARGEQVDPMALAPIYAREPEAVTKWRERRQKA